MPDIKTDPVAQAQEFDDSNPTAPPAPVRRPPPLAPVSSTQNFAALPDGRVVTSNAEGAVTGRYATKADAEKAFAGTNIKVPWAKEPAPQKPAKEDPKK